MRWIARSLLLLVLVVGCSGSSTDGPPVGGDDDDDSTPTPTPTQTPQPTSTPGSLSLTVTTYNTGTSESMGHDSGPDDGYTSEHAALSDQYYGDGLAWIPAVEAAQAFFSQVQPDLVAFQEIFYSDLCAGIPEDAKTDFVCESWTPGDPTVAQVILGNGYQVMCNPGKDDKCAAVKKSFGTFRGCDQDFCLEGMDGFKVNDCGGGARVGRAIVDLTDGGSLVLITYHGTSGFSSEEQLCRALQTDQVFVDLGDGAPGIIGEHNIVMGDLNTDPGRVAGLDASAAHWLEFVDLPGDNEHVFSFVTDIGDGAEPTYSGLFNIDHVMSDAGTGDCWVAGIDGNPPVSDAKYFDHMPVTCEIGMSYPPPIP